MLSKYWEEIHSKKNLGFEGNFIFIKTHHALIEFLGNPYTTKTETRGIIYIVRDPRDVVISFSHHYNFSIDESIEIIKDKKFLLQWEDNANIFLDKKQAILFSNKNKIFIKVI